MIIGGKVIDVSKYLEDHPGGEEVLLRGAASLLEDTPADPMLKRAALQHAPPAGSVGEGVSRRTLPF
mgnify:CR=1 FL=1